MKQKKLTTFLVAWLLLFARAAYADPKLIAIGTVSGLYQDFATQTAGLLENGFPGNRLGGIGSGLAYAGGNTSSARLRIRPIPSMGLLRIRTSSLCSSSATATCRASFPSASKHFLPVMTEKTTKIGTTKKVQHEASGGRSFNPFRRSFDRLKSMRGSL